MAETEEGIVIGVKVKDNEAKNSVKSLKSELRQLTNELAQLEPGSEAFVKTAKKAGELKDKIEDTKNAVKAFNPEAKFQAFANVVGGVANGFAVAQGAMQLFGSENKNLQKMMAQTQAAIAIATGLNGLLGMGDSLKLFKSQLVDAVKGLFTLRGALIATGIGAIAIAVGTLVANWKSFSKAITEAFPGFKVVTDFFTNFRQIAFGTLSAVTEGFKVVGDVISKIFKGDFSGAIESAKTFGERTANAYNEGFAEEDKKVKIENSLKQRKFEIELEEAKGKDVLAKKLKLQQDELKLLEKGSDEYNQKLVEIEKTRTDIRNKGIEKRKEADEKEKKIYDDTIKRFKNEIDALIDKNQKAFEEIGKRTDAEIAQVERYKNLLDKDLANTKYTNQQKLEEVQEFYKKGIISEKEFLKYKEDISKAQKEIDKQEKESKINQLNMTADALNSFADLAGKNTAEGKALAVTSTLISTYLSAQKAFESAFLPVSTVASPFIGALSAAAAVASGLANVNAILSVPVPGGSGGGSPSFSRPAIPPMVRPSSNMVSIGNESIKTQSNGIDQKVYVVESDITNTQNKVKSIESKATIG
jgi:hypothetical protein